MGIVLYTPGNRAPQSVFVHMWSLRCFDEVFGELVDDLVAVLGDDALVVLDGDLLADVAELVHEISLGRRP